MQIDVTTTAQLVPVNQFCNWLLPQQVSIQNRGDYPVHFTAHWTATTADCIKIPAWRSHWIWLTQSIEWLSVISNGGTSSTIITALGYEVAPPAPPPSYATIAFDASSFNGGTSWTTHTLSHTCSWTNRYLFVSCYIANSSNVITWVTYAGQAMSLIRYVSSALVVGSEGVALYWLINPASWTNTIEVTTSSSTTIIMQNASYTWVSQTSQPASNNSDWYYVSSNWVAPTITTTVDNSCIVWVFRSGGNQIPNAWTTIRTGINQTLQIADWLALPVWVNSIWYTLSPNEIAVAIVASIEPALI